MRGPEFGTPDVNFRFLQGLVSEYSWNLVRHDNLWSNYCCSVRVTIPVLDVVWEFFWLPMRIQLSSETNCLYALVKTFGTVQFTSHSPCGLVWCQQPHRFAYREPKNYIFPVPIFFKPTLSIISGLKFEYGDISENMYRDFITRNLIVLICLHGTGFLRISRNVSKWLKGLKKQWWGSTNSLRLDRWWRICSLP